MADLVRVVMVYGVGIIIIRSPGVVLVSVTHFISFVSYYLHQSPVFSFLLYNPFFWGTHFSSGRNGSVREDTRRVLYIDVNFLTNQ